MTTTKTSVMRTHLCAVLSTRTTSSSCRTSTSTSVLRFVHLAMFVRLDLAPRHAHTC